MRTSLKGYIQDLDTLCIQGESLCPTLYLWLNIILNSVHVWLHMSNYGCLLMYLIMIINLGNWIDWLRYKVIATEIFTSMHYFELKNVSLQNALVGKSLIYIKSKWLPIQIQGNTSLSWSNQVENHTSIIILLKV